MHRVASKQKVFKDVSWQLCPMHAEGSCAEWWNSVKVFGDLSMDMLLNLRDAQILLCKEELLGVWHAEELTQIVDLLPKWGQESHVWRSATHHPDL